MYLALSHDTPCGSLSLKNDLPLLDMSGEERASVMDQVKRMMVKMTHALGGSHLETGLKATVHPLGGLGFAGDGTGLTGSVNHTGELFSGSSSEVHAGLCVVDGSVVSRSLAANPLATITALAERSVELMIKSKGLKLDLALKSPYRPTCHQPRVTFAEKMAGEVTIEGQPELLTLYVDV